MIKRLNIIDTFWLKIIACLIMLIDHLAIGLQTYNVMPMWMNYQFMRSIGRIAFVLFAFMIANGAFYTKSKPKYALRLGVLAIISEVPFDLICNKRFFSYSSSNIFFTLLLGLCCIYLIQWVDKTWNVEDKPLFLKVFITIITAFIVLIVLFVASFVLKVDYKASGVLCIIIFGVGKLLVFNLQNEFNDKPDKITIFITARKIIDIICAALACIVLLMLASNEIYGFWSCGIIALYSYKKGLCSKPIQFSFYFFYPVHLFLVYLLSSVVLH